MADLRPLGSERLEGTDKIRRIMEIARYGEVEPASINENKTVEYTIQLADGNFYGIVREKSGYIVKKGLTESSLDYSEPMKNRKYFNSYSQAMRKINLIAGELNRLTENVEGINLVGEQKKFVLKTPKTDTPTETPAEEPSMELPPIAEPASEPSSEPESSTGLEDLDLGLDMETPAGDEEVSLDTDVEMPTNGDEEEVSFKSIQKLTGKLGQKIRTLDGQQGMTSEDIKYVLNSILSALDLSKLTEEDYDDVMANFEENEEGIDYGVDDETELDVEAGDDLDLSTDLEMEPEATEGEIEEEMYGSFGNLKRKDSKGDTYYNELSKPVKDVDLYGIGDDEMFDTEEFENFMQLYDKYGDKQNWFASPERGGEKFFNLYKEKTGKPFKVKTRKMQGEMGEGSMEDMGIQTLPSLDYEEQTIELSPETIKSDLHSTIDQVLSKYFAPTEEEQQMFEQKEVKKFLGNKVKSSVMKNQVKKLAETVEQEMTADFILREHNNVKFLGKTNKNNLVFEADDVQLKVSTKGEIL
jgi:hypothetical protein